PPGRVGDEPRREAPAREGGEDQRPPGAGVGEGPALLLRRRGRCCLRPASDNEGSSTAGSCSPTRNVRRTTCSRSSIGDGEYPSLCWTCPWAGSGTSMAHFVSISLDLAPRSERATLDDSSRS